MTIRNILVVDDTLVERVLVEGLLAKEPDYHVQLASGGQDALRRIAESPPDLVITDLVMPDMNGLDLVRAVRRQFPEIPVILLTAYGDESTAIEALEAGAASYVPKARQAERLLETVRRVVEHAAAEECRERLDQCMLDYHCRFALDNDPALIRALADRMQQVMADIGFADKVERIRLGEALEEAPLNAMFHGNLEISEEELARVRGELDEREIQALIEKRCRDPHIRRRKIIVVAHITPNEARFVVRDEGRGFKSTLSAGRDRSDRFETGRHRGLTLIQSLMDEVSFNEAGNELTMRKSAAR